MRHSRSRCLFSVPAFSILCAILAMPNVGVSQATLSGALLRGIVKDQTGAVIPGASLTATNADTNVSQSETSDEQGRYVFPNLTPGEYSVRVEVQGFKTVVHRGIVLRVNQATDVDFSMEVGSVAVSVEVVGAPPLLDTVSGSLGAVVDNRYITEVPLFDRELTRLAYLAPGVTMSANDAFSTSPTGFTGTNFTSNGQRASTAEVRWDGAVSSAPDGTGGGISFFYPWTQPSPEAVQEFKVMTNSFSAEYGSNGGTVINVVSKSGTNEFHGSGYWWHRQSSWDAGGFFENRNCPPTGDPARPEDGCKGDFKRDNFGGSIGGPIFKDKTFFFFDYDRIRIPGGTFTYTATVPTAIERQGDFSQTLNPDGSTRIIYDPETVDPATLQRQPFPGNVIPPGRIDPIAAAIVNFFPMPTGPGDPLTARDNYTNPNASFGDSPSDKWDLKIDHVFSEKSRLTGRYSRAWFPSNPSSSLGENNPADSGQVGANFVNHSGVLEHAWTLGPNAIWANRAGLTRYVRDPRIIEFDPLAPPPNGFGQAGETFAELQAIGGAKLFPIIWPLGFFPGEYPQLGPSFAVWTEHTTLPSFDSTFSLVKGAHTLKFGAQHKMFFSNYFAPNAPQGWFMFDVFGMSATEEFIFGFNPVQGHPLASLLVGWGEPLFSFGGVDVQPASATKSSDTSFYVQDDYRLTQRLTLNLGLRYEWMSPFTERFDRHQILDPDFDTGIDVDLFGTGELTRLRGRAQLANADQRAAKADRNNWAPRFGFAYRLKDKTVLRGGAGVYYSITQQQGNWLLSSAFRKTTVWRPTLDSGITRFATLADPFPAGNFLPQERKYGDLANWGTGADQLSSHTPNPEMYMWNFGLEHQLTDTLLLEVAYSGNRSTHLPLGEFWNYQQISVEDREFWGSAGLGELIPNPFFDMFCSAFDPATSLCTAPGTHFDEPDASYSQPFISRGALLGTFPQFAGGLSSKAALPVATSRYNSLMFRFEKRYSKGLNFNGHYTYSKFMSDAGSANIAWLGNSAVGLQDVHNRRADWSVDGADTPHRLVFGWSYELPFGRGKPIANGVNRVLNGIVGGWQVNGVLTLQSGFPIALSTTTPISGGTQRPNIQGNPRSQHNDREVVDSRGDVRYFNYNPAAINCSDAGAGAICAAPDQIPGNAPRYNDDLREPMINNLDLSVFKNFTWGEHKRLQIRAEFFNFTNTPIFGVGNHPFGAGGDSIILGAENFGAINRTVNTARQFQLAFRFLF